MKPSTKTFLFAAGLLGTSSLLLQAQTSKVPQLGNATVKQIVGAMTLEEKASLVVGTGMNLAIPGMTTVGQTKEIVEGAAGATFTISRLGITPTVLADGPAGLRISPTRKGDEKTYYCTAFPVGTLLASTWNTELVNQVGQAMGNEVLEYGVDIILGPGLNIHRNPLCGRNFEYYSEDPYVSGKMAAAMIQGVESNGVGTAPKHFAANNSETNRNSLDTKVSERALREIYLEGFRIAVQEGQPWTVMSSYNLINGTYASESYDLLTNILRKDWGFKGYVMTDWLGGKDAVAQMKAGNDLLMPGSKSQTAEIINAVQDGKLDVKVLDLNVERILNIIVQGPRFKGYKYSNKPDLKENAQVTRQSATEGMVLLKNDNSTLPFGNDVKKLAVFGNTSYAIFTGGTGSGDVNEAYSVSLIEGLNNAGLSINENLHAMYKAYTEAVKEGRPKREGVELMLLGTEPIEEFSVTEGLATSMAGAADAAIITIGRNAGEGRDRSNVEGDFKLTATEKELIKSVTAAFQAKDKRTVVILNVGGVVETATWKDQPNAILLAWQGGQEGGNSIADILTGKANPSGKLASTFPVKYEDVPSAATFPGKEFPSDLPKNKSPLAFMLGRPAEIIYDDGIYVGYRYYETFGVKPSFEFGYGLSYTTFEYSNLKLSATKFNGKMTVTVDIKNTGTVSGKEVAELYLSAPAKKLDKPAIELKGFAKTRLLQPGETQTLAFVLDSRSLASFDPSVSAWIADAGSYTVKMGASSKDIRLSETFTLSRDLTVKKETVALVPQEKVLEIKPGKK
jgi:beta-glucosidase